MRDAVPGNPGHCVFVIHCEGESLPEGVIQPGQELPGVLTVREEGFEDSSLEWFPWERVTLLVQYKAEKTVMKKP